VRWIEMLAVGVFVYQRTGSAFLVAMMTMLRLLPMGLFGAFLGGMAERFERRTVLLVVVAGMLATSLAIAALAHTGHCRRRRQSRPMERRHGGAAGGVKSGHW
jgi:MFS family permease